MCTAIFKVKYKIKPLIMKMFNILIIFRSLKSSYPICVGGKKRNEADIAWAKFFKDFKPGLNSCLSPCKMTFIKEYVYSYKEMVGFLLQNESFFTKKICCFKFYSS